MNNFTTIDRPIQSPVHSPALISLHFPLQAFLAEAGNNDIMAVVFLCWAADQGQWQSEVCVRGEGGGVYFHWVISSSWVTALPPDSGVIQGQGEKRSPREDDQRSDSPCVDLTSPLF